MNIFSLQDVTSECEPYIQDIKDETIQKIYSKFKFLYFDAQQFYENQKSNTSNPKSSIQYKEQSIIHNEKTILLNFLNNFKFLAVEFFENSKSFQKSNHSSPNKGETSSLASYINVIFCSEDYCLIVQNINTKLIQDIMQIIKSISSIINISTIKDFQELNNENVQALTEVNNFFNHFKNKIKQNIFIMKTLRPIAGYLIRRYYYPSSFFKNIDFFTFDQARNNSFENNFKRSFNYLLGIKKDMVLKNSLLLAQLEGAFEINYLNYTKYMVSNTNHSYIDQDIIYDFNKNDFIILRSIFQNRDLNYNLVIHKKSLYLFALKTNFVEMIHEKDFCDFYSNRCFVRFYGYVKEGTLDKGLVFDFMSNGTLSQFIQNNKDKINNFYSFVAMNRIFEGINYLHYNSLVHRDIKPDNILINHDRIPFISDFQTIRLLNDIDNINEEDQTDEQMTKDLGSNNYAAPEQHLGNASFSSDIYSFGLIVYFLFEHKNMFQEWMPYEMIMEKLQKGNIEIMTKGSKNIQEIYNLCVKFDPKKRCNAQEIIDRIINEFISINIIEQFRQKERIEIDEFFFQNICFIFQQDDKMHGIYEFTKNIYYYIFNYYKKVEQNVLFEYNDENSTKQQLSSLFIRIGLIIDLSQSKDSDLIASKFVELGAKLGNSDILYSLGDFYFNGNNNKAKRDYTKAIKYYEMSAKQNNPNALYCLGVIYENGYGVKHNILKAIEYYEASAKLNDSDSLLNLGGIYFKGHGEIIQQDYSKAVEYYEQSAKLNNSQALYNLGVIYKNGIGVEKDYTKAKEYFDSAARQEYPQANSDLAVFYLNELGVNKDIKKALDHCRYEGYQNDSQSLFILGNIYENGSGVAKDLRRAIHYYTLSANLKNSRAMLALGNLYLNGCPFFQPDYSKAREFYESAAEQYESMALFNLGIIYNHGFGVKQDYEKAAHFYNLSAREGNHLALYNLGSLYLDGLGVEKNIKKAIEFYELAGEKDNLNALYSLGTHFYAGDIIGIDIDKAIKYFLKIVYIYETKKSVFEGVEYKQLNIINYHRACNDLGVIYATIEEKKNKDDAEKYLKKAAYSNFPFGRNNLGLLYQFILKDNKKAESNFEEAAKSKFCLSEFNLGFLREKEGENDESIQFYMNAVEHEATPLMFHSHNVIDTRLDYSIEFVTCLASLKIVKHFLCRKDKESHKSTIKKYLYRIFSDENNMIDESYLFKMTGDDGTEMNIYDYIEDILIAGQPQENILTYQSKETDMSENQKFTILFDYLFENQLFTDAFIEQVDIIIGKMTEVLYSPPYSILFGRMQINEKLEENDYPEINQCFYDGFGSDLCECLNLQ